MSYDKVSYNLQFQELVKKSKETSDLVIPGTSGKKFGKGKGPAKKSKGSDDDGDSDAGSTTNGDTSGTYIIEVW